MKKNYIRPWATSVVMETSLMAGVSGDEYDLGNQNNQSGGTGDDHGSGPGAIGGGSGAKGISWGWDNDMASASDFE